MDWYRSKVLEQYVLTDIKTKMGTPGYTSATRATPTTTVLPYLPRVRGFFRKAVCCEGRRR
ncbi:unnamed protein product [Ectocarpus sp. CCAP 1310/34]|nr:unnamed protein product [Ectocarpus sp. CCAP 1310/34]